MLKILVVTGLLAGLILCGLFLTFRSKDHSRYDHPRPSSNDGRSGESVEHIAITQLIQDERAATPKMNRQELLHHMRQQMDRRGAAFETAAEIRPTLVNGMAAEWVIAENARQARRVLYIHGGAYMVGSPISHRPITSRLSKVTDAAVLVIDYRLMPENTRMAGIVDCQNAYRWVLENGPDGASDVEILIIAGDSSGGNLALSTVAWARDAGLRPADAVVVFSPQTDLTLGSLSLVANIQSDIMQGDSFGPIVKAPKIFGLLFSYLMHRINPSNPVVSPLLGDLSGLPPTLIQVSEAEMFFDDAVRYVNKSNAQGSTAIIQTWPHTLHVWQAFQTPEADEAFAAVGKFIFDHM